MPKDFKDFEPYTAAEKSPNREAANKHARGSRKYREWVHKQSKQLDDHANLPFTIGKPAKTTRARRDVYFLCEACGSVKAVSKYTAGVVCPKCKKFGSVNSDNRFTDLKELSAAVDKLEQDRSAKA